MADLKDPQVFQFTPITPLPAGRSWPRQFRLFPNSWLRWDEIERSDRLIDRSYCATARIVDGPVRNPPEYILDPAPGVEMLHSVIPIEGLGTFRQIRGPTTGR